MAGRGRADLLCVPVPHGRSRAASAARLPERRSHAISMSYRITAESFYMYTASTGRGPFMAGEEMIRIAVSELERLISTKNVVGEPIAMGDRVMIPISGYGFGFGGAFGQGQRGREPGRRRRRGLGRRRCGGRHSDRGRGPGRDGLRPHGRAGPSPEEEVGAGRGDLDALVLARAPGDRRPQVQAGRLRHFRGRYAEEEGCEPSSSSTV